MSRESVHSHNFIYNEGVGTSWLREAHTHIQNRTTGFLFWIFCKATFFCIPQYFWLLRCFKEEGNMIQFAEKLEPSIATKTNSKLQKTTFKIKGWIGRHLSDDIYETETFRYKHKMTTIHFPFGQNRSLTWCILISIIVSSKQPIPTLHTEYGIPCEAFKFWEFRLLADIFMNFPSNKYTYCAVSYPKKFGFGLSHLQKKRPWSENKLVYRQVSEI